MKRLLALVVVLVLALTCLAGCSVVDTVKDKINTILGKEPEGNTQLDKADAFLFDLYKNAATETPSSYNLVSVVTIEGVKFTVTWESDNEAVTIAAAEDPNFVTVTVPKANEPIRYTLTATIKDDAGNVKTRTFQRTVPAFKVFTFAEYAAAADDATVVVRGVVSGIFSKTNGSSGNGVYIQDLKGEGGYYVYGLVDSKDPEADLGLKVGMTVTVSGIKDTYNGLYEVVSANIEIDDATIKTVEPVDFTEIYKNATALTDAALVTRQSMLVTVKGVEVGGVKEDNGYYYFKLGALESYIRISSSNNCISKADIDTFKANHTSHKGYKADVTGIIQLYNGAFYLIPVSVDVETNYAEIERTDAEKVTFELEGVTLPEIITEDGVITVPAVGAKYNNVVLTYVSDNACITYENGKLTVTLPEANTKVTVTVTATLGEGETAITETATFVISVKAATKGVYIGKPEANPVAGKAYKFYLTAKDGLNYYFTGLISDKYLQTSTNVADGVDVYLEEVKDAEGKVTGYYISFMDGETKTYITIAEGKAALTTENPVAFNYVAETNSWTDGTNYLGTYSKYTTISASANSFINAENTGTSQFPANFAVAVAATYVPNAEKAPVAGTAYKFFLTAKDGLNYYFTGLISDKYLQTSTNAADGVDVYLEEVKDAEGKVTGYYIYFMDGETKTYITITDGKAALTTENPVAFNYVAETNSWTDGTNYLGTYSKYTTISASANSFINAENTGTSQFPAGFASLTAVEITSKPEKAPVAGTAYKFFLTAKDGLNYYFTGIISDKYLQTTTDLNKAVDVYLEEVKDAEGKVTGYYIYFMDGETKTYITITDGKAALTTENPVAFNYVAETNSWTDGTNYLGTYSKYTTISASANSFINAENTGTSQFPAGFATVVVAEEKEITAEEKVDEEKKKLTIQNKFVEDGSLELPAVGEKYEDVVITWTVNGAAVEGKYDVVLGAEEQTLTVVATIKVGETSVTKEFSVTVAAKPSFEITYPTTIVPGTAYHIYTPEGPVFFGGALSDKNGLATVDTLEEATAIYFEAAATEGTFYMYFYDANGAKKYIDMTANSTTKFALVDTAPEKGIWAIDEFGIYNAYWYTDNSAKPDGVSYYRYLAFYANNSDVRTYAPSTTGNPWMKLAEVSEGHTHTDANTDGVCDGCQQEVDETGDTPLTGTDAN